jgi:hypothetical protein
LQGIVKPALQRLRDSYNARARELADEMLSLQVRHTPPPRQGALET